MVVKSIAYLSIALLKDLNVMTVYWLIADFMDSLN